MARFIRTLLITAASSGLGIDVLLATVGIGSKRDDVVAIGSPMAVYLALTAPQNFSAGCQTLRR